MFPNGQVTLPPVAEVRTLPPEIEESATTVHGESKRPEHSQRGVPTNGTSMAAPHVSGALALILAATHVRSVPAARRAFVLQDLITSSVEEIGDAGRDHRFGFGRINVLRALALAKDPGDADEATVARILLGTRSEIPARLLFVTDVLCRVPSAVLPRVVASSLPPIAWRV